MQRIREKLLIFRASEGKDSEAFGELYGLYKECIQRFVYFRTGSKEDAEDLVSQAFLKTWEYLIDADKPRVQNFRAFIYQVARNLVARFYENKGRIPVIVEIDDLEEYQEIPDEREDIFVKQMAAADIDHLIESAQKLPEPYKEAIALKFFEELSSQEIAQIMEKTVNNINVLIYRGKKMLKEIMSKPRQKFDNVFHKSKT